MPLTAASLLAMSAVVVAYRQISRDVLIIEPFAVPKEFSAAGLNGDVIANHIADELQELERDVKSAVDDSRVKADSLALSAEVSPSPNIEVPGTRMGFNDVVQMIREALGRHPRRVRPT